MQALGQTIQVVDKSGKVVSTSRHLLNVFKIGREAYNDSKKKVNEKRASEASQSKASRSRHGRAYTLEDSGSTRSGRSHRSHRSRADPSAPRSRQIEAPRSPDGAWSPDEIAAGVPFYQAFPEYAQRPQSTRRHSEFHIRPDSHHANSDPVPHHYQPTVPPQPQWQYPPEPYHNRSLYKPQRAPQAAPQQFEAPPMVRRNTTQTKRTADEIRQKEGIDLDLAYGDVPPDLLYPGSRAVAPTPEQEEAQLTGLVGKANYLLEEANCLKSGATATISHLQKNPDAMAAVGLTLAEISKLLKKVSPSVLTNLKTLSPAVFSLLAHPQFLIAAGVATGVTIIAFGGYKIIKRIQERREMESLGDEAMMPVEEVSRIESWRRGIADAEARSVGTSVDGEIITPLAANLSRMNLAEDIRERELERSRSERQRQGEKDRRRATVDEGRSPRGRVPRSVTSSRSERSHRSTRSSSEPRASKSRMDGTSSGKSSKNGSVRRIKTTSKKQVVKPSPLRRLLLT